MNSIYGLIIEENAFLNRFNLTSNNKAIDISIKELLPGSAGQPAIDWGNVGGQRKVLNPIIQKQKIVDEEWIQIQYGDNTGFLINRAGTQVWVRHPPEATIEDTATYILGPILGIILRLRGTTALHASAVAIDNQCLILVGNASAGKSTTAAAFSLLGHPVLSEDVAALDEQGSSYWVQPGYPHINLWPPSVALLFGSAEALPRICPLHPNWDKRYLDLTQAPYQFQAEPLPLGAIYVLEDRDKDEAVPKIEPLVGPEAFLALVANTYANYLLDKGMRTQEFELLSRLVQHVPIRRVTPHADPVRIWDLCRAIITDFCSLNPDLPADETQQKITPHD